MSRRPSPAALGGGAAWATVLVVVLITSLASARETVLLLLAERTTDGTEQWWWSCSERQPQPVSDRLGPQLSQLGAKVIDRCDVLESPIHRTYHQPELEPHQIVNLGNVVGATRVVWGTARLANAQPIRDLGLHQVEATLTLTATDLETEKAVASLTATVHGFAHDAEAARQRAQELLLARLLPRLGELTHRAGPTTVASAQLRITLPKHGELAAITAAVRALPDVSMARPAELRAADVLLEVRPATARPAVEALLRARGLRFTVENPPPAQNL